MQLITLQNKLTTLRADLVSSGIAVISGTVDHTTYMDDKGRCCGRYYVRISTEYGDASESVNDEVDNLIESIGHVFGVLIPAKIGQLLIADKSIRPIQDDDDEDDIREMIGDAIDWEVEPGNEVSIVTGSIKVRAVASVDVPTAIIGEQDLPGITDELYHWRASLVGLYDCTPLATLEPGRVYTYEIFEVR